MNSIPGGGDHKQKIGRQIILPFSKAFEIALGGLRIRIWRSLITMSGIVLAIAFLMSVWTSGVFSRALRAVPTDHGLYPLVRQALASEAISSGGVRITCAVVEQRTEEVTAGQITPGKSIRNYLDEEEAFRAESVPADADAMEALFAAREDEALDVVILVGLPPVVSTPAVADALSQFVKGGGFLVVYGTAGLGDGAGSSVGPLADILPASPDGAPFEARGDRIEWTEHLAAAGASWRHHPDAQLLALNGKADSVAIASVGNQAVAWVRDVGQGSVAWYPATAESAARPDLISWFLRGRTTEAVAAGGNGGGLLQKMISYGCWEKIRTEEYDVRGIWLVSLSLMVCVVGITNAMLMSVTERYREIGTMKCLGALDKFVVKLFLIESSLQGVIGSVAGALIGFTLSFLRMLFTFRVENLQTGDRFWLALEFFPAINLLAWLCIALVVGMVLSVVAAVYPAVRAARMQPVEAMRGEA